MDPVVEKASTPESTPGTTGPAESSPAAVETPVKVSFIDVLKDATPEERRDWEQGKTDETQLFDRVEKRKAETKPVATEPESAPGTLEPKKALTPEERSERDSRRSGIRQREYYQRQMAEERTKRLDIERKLAEVEGRKPESAPGTAPQGPEMPDMADAKYSGVEGLKLYQSDLKKFIREDREFDRTQRESVHTQAQRESDEQVETAELQDQWKKNEAPVLKDFPEYAAAKQAAIKRVADTAPAIAEALMRIPEGPRLLLYLGIQHPEELERLAELHSDEAKMELGLLRKSLKPAPQPNKETKAPPPLNPTNGRDQVVGDPAEAARLKGDMATWEKLENERDLREWGLLT